MPLDANGIHIYDESEAFDTASELLNALGGSVSTRLGALTAGQIPDVAAIIQTSQVASGTTLATLTLPALTVPTKATVVVLGYAGYAGGASDFGVLVTASAGTLTVPQNARVPAAAGAYATWATGATLVLPAGTDSTVTIKSDSSTSVYWRGLATAHRWATA
jgi:hypothetical protein